MTATHTGDVGTEIAPEVADDPGLAARLDDLLHRTCSLARALAGAEQAALSVDLDGDGRATRKFFNLSERYERWRDYRVDPRGLGLHGIRLDPGQVQELPAAIKPEVVDALSNALQTTFLVADHSVGTLASLEIP